MTHKRIGICVGFYRPGTGLSRVLETILQHIEGMELHFIGISYKGETQTLNGRHTLYPCNLQGGDVYGAFQLKKRIASLQPDFVFLLNDLWNLSLYGKVCAEEAKQIPFIAYAALDGKIVKPDTVNGLGFLSHLVAYTQFAYQQIELAIQDNHEYQSVTVPKLHIIPHGVDSDCFYPLNNIAELKRQWLAFFDIEQDIEKDITENYFVVLNANRPHGRKRIDLTIQAFAIFAQQVKRDIHNQRQPLLILHNTVISPEERAGLEQCTKDQGVEGLVKITPEDAPFFDDGKLNSLYNACDVGINTSMGEGWGMVSLEHAATGRPQIVPSHSACGELWKNHALCIGDSKAYVPKFSLLELVEIDVTGAAKALEKLYEEKNYSTVASSCYSRALEEQFEWPTIGKEWQNLFELACQNTTST